MKARIIVLKISIPNDILHIMSEILLLNLFYTLIFKEIIHDLNTFYLVLSNWKGKHELGICAMCISILVLLRIVKCSFHLKHITLIDNFKCGFLKQLKIFIYWNKRGFIFKRVHKNKYFFREWIESDSENMHQSNILEHSDFEWKIQRKTIREST